MKKHGKNLKCILLYEGNQFKKTTYWYYEQNYVPPNSNVEALTPKLTVFGDKTFGSN